MLRRRDFLRGGSALALISASRAEAWVRGAGATAQPSQWQTLPVGGGGYHTKLAMHSSGFFAIGADNSTGGIGVNGGSTVTGSVNTWLGGPTQIPASYTGTPFLPGDCYGLGIDPNNASKIYTWMSPASFAPSLTFLWKTSDQGAHWSVTGFPQINVSGNETLRYYKNRQIAVDPANSNVTYAGGPANLYVSLDGGATASTVSGVPAATLTISSDAVGVNAIVFDPTSGTTTWNPGSGNVTVTSRILCASGGNGIYQSLDGGQTWSEITGGSITDVGKGWMASDGWSYFLGIPTGSIKSGLHRVSPGGTVDSITGTSAIWSLALDPGDTTHAWATASARGIYTFSGAINGGSPPTITPGVSFNFWNVVGNQVPWLGNVGPNITEVAWDPLVATSASSVTIAGTGTVSWSDLPSGLNIVVGDVIRAHVTGTPTSYMLGVVTAYNASTGGNLTLALGNVYTAAGSIGNGGTASSTVTMGTSAPADVTPGMMVFNGTTAIGKVRSWVGTTLTIWYSSNSISNGNSITFSINEGAEYLCASTGGSGAHSAWTFTKERIWSAEGIGIRFYDPINFDKIAIPLLGVDQSSGLESLGACTAIWPPKPAPGPVLIASDFAFHALPSNPIGTTGATYLSNLAGAGHASSVMDAEVACWARSSPTTMFGYCGVNFGSGLANQLGVSTDGAKTWTTISPPTSTYYWFVAAATPSNVFVWSAATQVGYYSNDGGATWTASGGTLPAYVSGMLYATNRPLDVDDAGTYYLFGSAASGGTGYVYRSTTGGATFVKGANPVSGAYGKGRLVTVPGHNGHLFACNGYSGSGDTSSIANFVTSWPGTTGLPLNFSSDGGDTWTSMPSTVMALCVSVGAPKPGGSGYPSIWWVGWTANDPTTFGIYRIDDFNPASPASTPTHTKTGDYVGNRIDLPTGIAASPDAWDWAIVGYAASGWAIRGSAGGSWPP